MVLRSFADCLEKQLTASPEDGQAAVAAQQRPVSGLSLAFGALRSALARLGRRMRGRG